MRRACVAALAFCAAVAGAARNVSVDDSSAQWTYSPPVCRQACDGAQSDVPRGWWQLANVRDPAGLEGFFQSTETATDLVGASATLNFFGTHLYFYGTLSPYGGVMNMSLDGNVSFATTMLTLGSPVTRQALVWSAEGLAAETQHTLIVTMLSGAVIDVDRVDLTIPDSAGPSQTQTALSSPTGGNDAGTSQMPAGTIAAIVGGATGVMLLVFVALLFCLWRKRVREDGGDVRCPFERMRSTSREDVPPPSEVADPSHAQLPSPLPVHPPASSDPLRATFDIEPSPDYLRRHSEMSQRPRDRGSAGEFLHYAMVRTDSNEPRTVLVSKPEPDPLATPLPSPQLSLSTQMSSEIHFTPHRDIRDP